MRRQTSLAVYKTSLVIVMLWCVAAYEGAYAAADTQPPETVQDLCPSLLPKDAKRALQPLAPGYTWTYKTRVAGEPKSLRWLTKDFRSGFGFSALGLYMPLAEIKPGEYRVRYTVTADQKTFAGPGGKGCFFKILVTDLETQQPVLADEELYWGRWRYGSFQDIAICEVRTLGEVARQLLAIGPGPDLAHGGVHFRYLSKDILMDWPRPGEVTVGALNLKLEDTWHVKSQRDIHQVTVPAGTFSAILTTFEFDFGGHVETKILEKLYYVPGIGLVKWTQYEDEKELWSSELVSYTLQQ